MVRTARFVVACAAITAAPYMASADLLIDAGAGATTTSFTTGNYVAGSEFTVSVPTTIRSLGWLDLEGDGLAVSHRVGLWDVATQTLLTSATITPQSRSVASAHGPSKWFMEGVPDLVLAPGTYRVAGDVNGDNVSLVGARIAGSNTTLPAGYVRTDFPSGGFNYPNLSFPTDAVRATVSTDAVSSLIIDSGAAATTSVFTTGNYVAGSEFTLAVPTTIRSLGWLDVEGDGLAATHRIGIWNVATQTLMASTTVSPSSASVVSAHGASKWFMGRIRDIQLPAGTYRVAGEVSGDAIALINDKIPGPNTTLPVGYVRTDFPNGGFAFPGIVFNTENVRATLSTQAVTDLLVDAGPASVSQGFGTGNYVAGTEFTISSPMIIRSLGYLDAEGDGLAAAHQVGLWSVSSQTLLTSGTVTPASPVILAANGTAKWFMANCPAVLLLPGVYRVAGDVNNDGSALSDDKLPGPATSLSAGYYRTDFPNGGFGFPNLNFPSQAVRATASTRLVTAPPACYANCDASTTAPCLNVNDFTCFINRYSAANPYANCDQSTVAPVLNVNDFTCFLNKYSAGCTNPCAAP